MNAMKVRGVTRVAFRLVVCVGLLAGCAGEMSENYPQTHAGYAQLAEELERHLLENVLPAWFPRTVDPDGGFHGSFDRRWSPNGSDPRGLVYQARQTWVAATVAIEYPELAVEYRDIALHGAKYLRDEFWDDEYGGFFWALPETYPEPPHNALEKHLYGNAFAIYALVKTYEATREEELLRLAFDTFRWWEERAHDDVNGGYFEALTRDGQPIEAKDRTKPGRLLSPIHVTYGYKSANTCMHMMETLIALHRVSPNAEAEARLRELLDLFLGMIIVDASYLCEEFEPDWRPVSDTDSYGHDVEAAFLIMEAAAELGMSNDAEVMATARNLVDHAIEHGWDEKNGGFLYESSLVTGERDDRKSWWVQAEGLNALLLMHEHFGGETDRYWRLFLGQWEFIDSHVVDHTHGGWNMMTSTDGQVSGRSKANVWKAAYHNVRALVECSKRLRRLAGVQ